MYEAVSQTLRILDSCSTSKQPFCKDIELYKSFGNTVQVLLDAATACGTRVAGSLYSPPEKKSRRGLGEAVLLALSLGIPSLRKPVLPE